MADHLYCDYDENLSHNEFFRKLQSDHKIIVDTAPLENWVICIPRAATITPENLADPNFLLAHVLVPHDELPQTHFTNLLGVDLRLESKRLFSTTPTKQPLQRQHKTQFHPNATESLRISSESTTSSGIGGDDDTAATSSDAAAGGPIESYILFEEIFYAKQLMKYKVWCVESALLPAATRTASQSGDDTTTSADAPLYVVRNVKDAIDIIWSETRSNVLFRRIDLACAAFRQRPTTTVSSSSTALNGDGPEAVESLNDLYAATDALYVQCLRLLMQYGRLKEKCRRDVHIYRIMRIALETYIMNVVYDRVLDGIAMAHRDDGETFNRTLRGLADYNVSFFGVSTKHLDVVASVRTEMLRIEEYSTAIEKLACIRRSINATSGNGTRTLGVDDLIPILAFVICKSGLAHWTATQKFLQTFVFNELTETSDKGADSFLAATLEAAMTYIVGLSENKRNAEIEALTAPRPERRSKFAKHSDFIEYFFEAVRRGDEEEVLRLFGGESSRITVDAGHQAEMSVNHEGSNEGTDPDADDTDSFILIVETAADIIKLCHPLCACARCAAIARAQKLNVNTQNVHGVGAIHVAAMYGLTKMINVLLALGADVALLDENGWTALHYATQRDHQSAVLLLLHAGVDVNARSGNDLCTALHLACQNGHVGSAKAILYAAEQLRRRVEKNCLNRNGDTAVHLAARWGFTGIVETLLEYGVKVDIPNRDGRTASQSAHNSGVRSLLQNTFVVIDGPTAGGDGDWDELRVDETDAPFRGCLSEQMMLSEGGLGRRASECDKVIAAIRNGDTRLAFYFLGRQPEEEEGEDGVDGATACHPLCTCDRCAARKAKAAANQQSPGSIDHINGFNADGLTMLHAAASMPGNAKLVRFLLDQRASLKLRTPTLQSALHLAVLSGDTAVVGELLCVAGEYELNVQDADGNTALHLAVRTGNEPMVELLLRHEPWMDAVNNDRQTAADVARDGFMFNIARMLATEVTSTSGL